MAVTGQGFKNTFNSTLSSNSATALEDIGQMRVETDSTYGDRVYMYVLTGSAVANGDLLYQSGAGAYKFATGTGTTKRTKAHCVGQSTITSGYYGWVQVKGYHSAVKKIVTAAGVAGGIAAEQSSKLAPVAAAASGKFCNLLLNGDIIMLSARACACTTLPCMLYLM